MRALPAFNNGVSGGFEEYDVTPQDYYTIYNVNPVFNTNANLGAGATVAVIEESDFEYGTVNPSTGAATGGDVATFRSLFGVPGTLEHARLSRIWEREPATPPASTRKIRAKSPRRRWTPSGPTRWLRRPT